jgi:predicted AlkP superfamily phosphohydrolase/phosphomutase
MRIIAIALDGFDTKLFSMEEVSMLRELFTKQSASTLRSSVPYVTPTAFATILTGKSVGHHGVSGFLKLDGDAKTKPYNGNDIRSKTFQEVLCEHGKHCFMLGVPLSFPPRTEGDYVFDWLSGKVDINSLVYPPSLLKDFPLLSDIPIFKEYGHSPVDLMTKLKESTRKTMEAARSIIKSGKYDFSFFYIHAPDRIQHHLLNAIVNGERSKAVKIARSIFADIDKFVGTVAKELKGDDVLLVFSDHGFSTYDYQLHINDWLRENGYLYYGRSENSVDNTQVILERELSRRGERQSVKKVRVPKSLVKFLYRHRRLYRVASILRWQIGLSLGVGIEHSPSVDMDRSLAYCYEGAEQGIFINRKIVSADKVPELKREIMQKLSKIDGLDVYDKDEFYQGPNMSHLPDIYMASSKYCFRKGIGGSGIEKIPDADHRREGILIMLGNVFNNKPNDPSIMDIAPTILHLLGAPVLDTMQGRPLLETLNPSSAAGKRQLEFISEEMKQYEAVGLTPEEQEDVENRLKSLGYI